MSRSVTTRVGRYLTAAAICLAVSPAAASADGLPNRQRHVMSSGHADVINVSSEPSGTLKLEIKDDSGQSPVLRDPGTVILRARTPQAETSVPASANYSFLGQVGAPVWILPENNNASLLWAGWDSDGVDPGLFPEASLTWTIRSLTGPGGMSVYQTNFGTPTVLFNQRQPWPQSAAIANGGHGHANWAFSRKGLYRMVVEVTAVRSDNQTVSTGPVEYRWFVGNANDIPADDNGGGGSGGGSGSNDGGSGNNNNNGNNGSGGGSGGSRNTGGGSTGGGGGGGSSPPSGGSSRLQRVTIGLRGVQRPTVRALLRSGTVPVNCRMTVAGRCNVTVTVRAGGQTVTIAKGAVRVIAAGRRNLRLTLTTRGKRLLRSGTVTQIRIAGSARLTDGRKITAKPTIVRLRKS